jgi:hypothetical protein
MYIIYLCWIFVTPHNSVETLSCLQIDCVLHWNFSSASFLKKIQQNSFLLSLDFLEYFYNRSTSKSFKSQSITRFWSFILLKTNAHDYSLYTKSVRFLNPLFFWQSARLSDKALYSLRVNTSNQPTTAKLIKYKPSGL